MKQNPTQTSLGESSRADYKDERNGLEPSTPGTGIKLSQECRKVEKES